MVVRTLSETGVPLTLQADQQRHSEYPKDGLRALSVPQRSAHGKYLAHPTGFEPVTSASGAEFWGRSRVVADRERMMGSQFEEA